MSVGSVAFVESDVHPYTGEPIGARLISYALTDKPYIGGLEPHADGIVVGSALVRLVERFGNDRPALVAALEEFVRSVKSAMAGAAPHGEGA